MARIGDTFVIDKGMPYAIWNDKYARDTEQGVETWEERAEKVVAGNVAIQEKLRGNSYPKDRTTAFLRSMKSGLLPMSGRHLQHGDADQPNKRGEVFTNCSTACLSFMKFLLLMKGSGVGRLYDENICLTDWRLLPKVSLILNPLHPDFSPTDDYYLAGIPENENSNFTYFVVEDSAEGWASAIAVLEALGNINNPNPEGLDTIYIDFSLVRGKGSPIMGQQGRPASGPLPLMRAIQNAISKAQPIDYRWEQAMVVDHELSECVRVGGVRRSARIATKSWWDVGIDRFINIKKDGGLWTANNSVVVDDAFWDKLGTFDEEATDVWDKICAASYGHRTGEPGVINGSSLSWNETDVSNLSPEWYDYSVMSSLGVVNNSLSYCLLRDTLDRVKLHPTRVILNPCGEVPLAVYGGYCIIGEICLANAVSLEEVIVAVKECGRALVRVNLLPFTYFKEVARTNRIGVGITGIHEFAWSMFGLTWKDLCHYESSKQLWDFLQQCREEMKADLVEYCDELGVVFPHTYTCIKPSGTISKVMDCTEGAHLPAYDFYMRWVQFRADDEAIEDYFRRGFPVRDISHKYPGSWIVGFPTVTRCGKLMGAATTLAAEATMQEQYSFIELLEKYWLGPQGEGGQVSYTLKYDPEKISYEEYRESFTVGQASVRVCSVMPQVDLSAYAYQPEERITEHMYYSVMRDIAHIEQDGGAYDSESLICEGGACPIEPNIR